MEKKKLKKVHVPRLGLELAYQTILSQKQICTRQKYLIGLYTYNPFNYEHYIIMYQLGHERKIKASLLGKNVQPHKMRKLYNNMLVAVMVPEKIAGGLELSKCRQ